MKTSNDIRRQNLIHLRDSVGSTRALAEKVNTSEVMLSQWINASKDHKSGRPRQISHRSCRKVETYLGLQSGWMDQDHEAGTSTTTLINSNEAVSGSNLNTLAVTFGLAKRLGTLIRESEIPLSRLSQASNIDADTLYRLALHGENGSMTLEQMLGIADVLGYKARISLDGEVKQATPQAQPLGD